MSEPLVSVVTPFHNTESYLEECIRSVLALNYSNFEYILSDNCSTDRSSLIAEQYARTDPRIRLIRQPKLLNQVPHYNAALAAISPQSKYCKMVQADDRIFPECLRAMVDVAEQSESIGLISSYDLKGNTLRGSGFPLQESCISGTEMGRLVLRTGVYVFGSPSTVMYRSSVVRESPAFFRDGLLHEDTEKCMEILLQQDFGFVRQILSFSRDDNASISTSVSHFRPQILDRYILVSRFAKQFLEPAEAEALVHQVRREYYSALAEEAVRLRGKNFWSYNQRGLGTIGERLDRGYLGFRILCKLGWLLVNPGLAFLALREVLRRIWYGIGVRLSR